LKLINSDCIATMKAMPDNFIDAIVTDPPYELGFMGKSWDSTGIAFNIEVWQEALRVLKPGGHLIAFSGSRTYHRMAVAIEDAGFEIRDQIMWVYGSGFPKSMNLEKAINKMDGVEFIEKPASGVGFMNAEGAGGYNTTINQLEQVGDSSQRAKQWQGWGTALKPAHEPMVLARKPVIGTVANNVLTYGVGGLNIDGSRVAHLSEADRASATPQGKVTSNKMAGAAPDVDDIGRVEVERPDTSLGRWPANFIHDGSNEVVGLFPQTTSGKPSGKRGVSNHNVAYADVAVGSDLTGYGDSGSAARFFYCAKTSKRDRNEGLDEFEAKRDHDGQAEGKVGGDNPRNRTNAEKLNHHPTVKPTSLMQYLVRMVTPQGGTVLDPFMGSGSTGKACAYEGFNFIGIDQSAEYVEIARARIDYAIASKAEMLDLDGK
jgi:DNA modification methylase